MTRSGTGVGVVTSSPFGISCGTTCSGVFSLGAAVTLSAAATAPSTFGGWSGACTGTAPTCVVSMTQARSVTATFVGEAFARLTVTRAGLGVGTVVSSPAGIQCGTTCTATFGGAALVTLTAVSATGSVFDRWGGDCSGSGPTCVLVMNGDRVAVATFGGPNPTLTVTRAGTGAGVITSTPAAASCGASCWSYMPGTLVTLTATAASGSTFTGWSGGCTGAAPTCTVTMPANENVAVTATFDLVPATPCANPITFTPNTGNFGSTRAACYRTAQRVNGWGCANFQGRTVSVNAGPPSRTCGAGPFPLARAQDGYTYFSATAGTYPWASLYVW